MNGRIVTIEAFHVAAPLPQPLRLGAIAIPYREYAIVRVSDGDGSTGTAIGLARNAPIASTVLRTVAPHFADGSLDAYRELYNRAVAANVCLGTNGIFWRALSLMDCAMHDLMARRAGLPLHRLLGNPARAVPCVMVGGYPLDGETPVSLADDVRSLAALKPSGIKIGSCGDPSSDTSRLEACRNAMPDGPPLMIDMYWQCASAAELSKHAPAWSVFRMGWIEDPVAFDDYSGAAFLTDSLSYPVAIGDEQCGLLHFERLMDQGKTGVIRLDATVCGGVTGFLEIARAAAERNVPVACHIFPEMHVQLAALASNVRWVETFLPDGGLDSMHMLLRRVTLPEDGCISPGTTPGIGYEWDEDALNRYRRED